MKVFRIINLVTPKPGIAIITCLVEALSGGKLIEAEVSVIEEPDWTTISFSSADGCSMLCRPCLSGKGTQRLFSAEEMMCEIETVLRSPDHIALRALPLNFCATGDGEPGANAKNTVETLVRLSHYPWPHGVRSVLGSTHFGTPLLLKEFAARWGEFKKGVAVRVQVSLDGPTDDVRYKVSRRVRPVAEVMETVRWFTGTTHEKVRFNTVLYDGVNTDPEHAVAMAKLLGPGAFITVSPVNGSEDPGFFFPTLEVADEFSRILEDKGLNVERLYRTSIHRNATCGLLRHEELVNIAV